MERNEALKQFSLTAESMIDEINTTIEEKLFQHKNETLQKYMVPVLLQKKRMIIKGFLEAEKALKSDTNSTFEDALPLWSEKPTNRIIFLEQYESFISKLKLAASNATSFHRLHQVIESFILTQEYYMVLFRMLFSEFSEALPEEVNTREMIDTGKLLVALKSGEIENKVTWDIEREIARIDKIHNL